MIEIPFVYGMMCIGIIVLVLIAILIYDYFKEKKRNSAKNTNDSEQNNKIKEYI